MRQLYTAWLYSAVLCSMLQLYTPWPYCVCFMLQLYTTCPYYAVLWSVFRKINQMPFDAFYLHKESLLRLCFAFAQVDNMQFFLVHLKQRLLLIYSHCNIKVTFYVQFYKLGRAQANNCVSCAVFFQLYSGREEMIGIWVQTYRKQYYLN